MVYHVIYFLRFLVQKALFSLLCSFCKLSMVWINFGDSKAEIKKNCAANKGYASGLKPFIL